MPTVPDYQKQVTAQAAPNVQYSANSTAEDFGGGQLAQNLADGSKAITSTLSDIEVREKKKADDTATQDAWTQLVQAKNKLIYDPQQGAFQKRGKDALGVIDSYTPQFDQAADQIQASLTSQDQRDMFQHMRAKEKEEFNTTLTKHTASEIEQYKDQTSTATVKTAQDEAVLNYQDPEKINQSVSMIKATVMQQAADKGWSPEMTKLQVTNAVSQTHSQIINRYLDNGDDQSATAYFDANKSSFSGEDAAHMEKALEEGSTRGESQRASDDIMGRGLSMAAAQAEVRKIDNPKLRDATMDRVNQAYSQAEAAKRDADEKRYLSMTNIVEQTRDITQIPASTWAATPLAQREALKNYAKQGHETDMATFYDLKTQASTPELQDKFLKTNLLDYASKMSPSDLKDAIGWQTSLRSKDGKVDEKLAGFQSASQVVDEALGAAGINPHPRFGAVDPAVAEFHSQVEEKYQNFVQENNRKPTDVELKKISDQLLIQKTRAGSGFFGWLPTKKRDFQISTADIKPDDRSQIESALKLSGVPVNDQTVLALYKRKNWK